MINLEESKKITDNLTKYDNVELIENQMLNRKIEDKLYDCINLQYIIKFSSMDYLLFDNDMNLIETSINNVKYTYEDNLLKYVIVGNKLYDLQNYDEDLTKLSYKDIDDFISFNFYNPSYIDSEFPEKIIWFRYDQKNNRLPKYLLAYSGWIYIRNDNNNDNDDDDKFPIYEKYYNLYFPIINGKIFIGVNIFTNHNI